MPDRPTSRMSRLIKAPREAVYRACLDPKALAAWRVPDDMEAEVHAFDPCEGGLYRMSLTYRDPARAKDGKTAAATDTFQGRFVELVPGEKIVEAIAFDAADPRFAGEMTVTTLLADAGGGTEITMLFEGLPAGVRSEDNDEGTRQSLNKLAALLE